MVLALWRSGHFFAGSNDPERAKRVEGPPYGSVVLIFSQAEWWKVFFSVSASGLEPMEIFHSVGIEWWFSF